MLFITTLNENGYTDNWGKIFKKSILIPNGITEAIAVNSFTSPPPQIFNCHIIYVTTYVTSAEIIDAKMNLTLFENNDKIRFDDIPKIISPRVNMLGTIFLLTSKITAAEENEIVTII